MQRLCADAENDVEETGGRPRALGAT